MNRKTFQFAHRIVAVLMLASISAFAFVWTRSAASEQAPADAQNLQSKTTAKSNSTSETSGEVTLRAENRGFPLINLRDGKNFEARLTATDPADGQSFAASSGQPRTMTDTDLNADGAADLIVGLASGSGGQLAIYQGSLDTLSATTPEIFEGMKEGRFPAPFLPEASLINLPVAPDFIGTGDFNRDGIKDIIAAGRGDDKAFLLIGGIKGGYKTTFVELPGRVTAMLADNIDPLDNAADIAFAVAGENAASLVVYRGSADAFGDKPDFYPLPAEANSLAVGQLDSYSPMDIIASAGGKVVIVHGSYPDENETANTAKIEILDQFSDIAAVRVGNFVWDRENRPEIALLGNEGSVRILERGKLDKRAFTEAEYKSRPLKNRELMNQEEAIRNLNYQPQQMKVVRERWTETDRIQMAAPGNALSASSASFFTSARMTPFGTEDLLVVDSASQKINLLIANNEEVRKNGESLAFSASGDHAALTLDVEGGTPIAVLPMRLNVMNRPGIVLLNAESGVPMLAPAVPANTFNVTKTADTYDGACNADCSLREALQAANANTDSDIINVPAGTYTINTALGNPDNDTAIDPAAQQSGDWDVFYDTTINGAGQATTILQAATVQPGHDRVLDAIQNGVGIPDLTLSGLTLRNGRCRADIPCVDGGGLRYAVDNLSVLTVSNSTFDSNRTEVSTANPANNGGGIFSGQSDANFTNVTVTNNTAAFVVSGGCTGATQCGGEGGGIFAGIRFTSNPTAVTITSSTITGNTANAVNGLGGRGGAYAGSPDSVTISGGTFNSNTAFTDGGALRLFTPTTITNSPTISSNSARQNGGGIWSDPLANDNTPQTNTFTGVIMRGNTADSDGVIAANNNNRGDGGAIFHGRGTLNLNNPTIGGTGAGEANTAYDGGGIARTYSQFTAAVFNASTLNINSGGSIVGNQANNNGGGIINDATKSAAAGNASVLNMTGATAVTLTNNRARNNGGGIAVITGSGSSGPAAAANLNNMTLRSNQANSDNSGGGDGGALHNDSGGVSGGGTTFTGSLTIGGSGFANSAVNGGGIRNNAGTVTIPASPSITFNTASGTGGGISNAGTLSALATATITNNTATGNGGGIFNSGTLGAISTPTLNSNSAANGGGIYTSSGVLTVTNGTINSNTATTAAAGGGILYAGSGASTVSGASVNGNTGSGIYITANALDITNTIINSNSADGISKTGAGTGSELISGNTISGNGALGIDLSDNGVTANDATGDADTGPNNLQNYPVINYVKRGDSTGNVTLNSTANRAFRINFFANTACDPSGNGEGEVSLGTQNVTTNASGTVTFTTAAFAYGTREFITATATDTVTGDTSEFSACRRVNTLPTFSNVQTPSSQQGSPIANPQIATVADPDQPVNTLSVTVRAVGAAAPGTGTATVNGVTVSNITVDASGNVRANIQASCSATNAAFTLRVTDGATEFNETTLDVTVTANTAPTVGNYPNTTINTASSGTVTPDAAPADNGSIASITATAPGFSGTLAGNTTTGVITVTNAAPAGTYTVTVTVTDNCGAQTTKQFTLTVNAIPTITAASGVSRQQGSAANSLIATVNDADQTEETLVVTIRAVGGAAPGTGTATVNGVTVSNISVSAAGAVTADIAAACAATNAAFTVRVTDANGAFNDATLNVTVTANTAPTVGNYANTTLAPGGGTIVTPSAAPADNGTVQSVTATAPAGFAGTLTTNAATGAVTIADANPVGTYTITVTVTDNCGTQTTRQFTLTVTNPPTITAATGITRGQGGLASVSQIATVSDANQAANTLVVTVNGGSTATVNGVTVSGINVDSSGNVTASIVAAANSTNASFTLRVTDAQGAFAETTLNVTVAVGGFESDVAPRPNGSGNGAVNTDDITQVQRFAVGLDLPYQSNEFQRADSAPRLASDSTPALGNGIVNAGDATQAQRYSRGFDPITAAGGPTGSASPLANALNAVSELENSPVELKTIQNVYELSAVRQSSTATTVTIAIQLTAGANKNSAAGFGGTLRFDAAAIGSPTNIRLGSGAPSGTSFFVNSTDTANGRLGFAINTPVDQTVAVGQQQLLLIDFTITGTGSTNLSFDDSQAQRFVGDANGNQLPSAVFSPTTISLSPTAAPATISGRVVTAANRGLGQAFVTLTDSNGAKRTATTNPFGYFRLTDIAAGINYAVTIQHKTQGFAPQVISVNNDLTDLQFIALP